MILAVDDDPVTLKLIQRILEQEEYQVQLATSVKEAVHLLEKNSNIRLLIVDIMMPGADGFDLLQFKRSFLKYRKMQVLMCTSLGDSQAVTKSLEFGANDYIVKPIKAEILLAKVKKLLEVRRHRILLVVTDKLVQNVLARLIEREGHEVVYACSGEDALKILSAEKVSLVISDMDLPQMSGLELMVAIKEKTPTTPVILVATNSGKFKEEDVISVGADGFISKPFRNIEIVRKLESLLPA